MRNRKEKHHRRASRVVRHILFAWNSSVDLWPFVLDDLIYYFLGRKQREVSRAEAERFAQEEGLLFIEASAKTGENVDRVRGSVYSYTLDLIWIALGI
jgi:hypothetical protein